MKQDLHQDHTHTDTSQHSRWNRPPHRRSQLLRTLLEEPLTAPEGLTSPVTEPVCLHLSVPVCLHLCVCTCLSIPVLLSVCLNLSVWLHLSASVFTSLYLSVCLYLSVYTCLSASVFLHLFVPVFFSPFLFVPVCLSAPVCLNMGNEKGGTSFGESGGQLRRTDDTGVVAVTGLVHGLKS